MLNLFEQLAHYNVVWERASRDSAGSMPLGNGDIGLNVWVEQDGDLLFYLGKTDAWSAHARLLKLGRVRVHLTPNPFLQGQPFLQTLQLAEGAIEIRAGDPARILTLRVDAHHPVIYVDTHSTRPFEVEVSLELWRTTARTLTGREKHSAYNLHEPYTIIETPDTVLPQQEHCITWFHRNTGSIWSETLELQGLDGFLPPSADPLLHRTFGGIIKGNTLLSRSPQTLQSVQPAIRHQFAIYLLTAQTATGQQWLDLLEASITAIEANDLDARHLRHRDWWRAFWERSWLFVSGTPEAEIVTRGAILQRFINACSGRGNAPIKFNGSIFTVDSVESGETYDADYRRWGGPYWFQNTRLPYWAMLACGDFDLLYPLFHMYLDALPLAQERTRRYFQHEGAFFPETMYFWGTYANSDYGWDRTQHDRSYVSNPYIRYYYQGGLELALLLLDYYVYTQDETFVTQTLLPLASSIVQFYTHHYPRAENGMLRLEPAQSLEMWHEAVNPLPEIAGLSVVLPRLLALPAHLLHTEQRADWKQLYEALPPLPAKEENGQRSLLPAESLSGPAMNSENPELYAVFPYRCYTVGTPDLQVGRETFHRRQIKETGGWRQDAIQAAYLGLTTFARDAVVKNFSTPHERSRFPAFWGPNFDWIPDQDHGNVALIALQAMLLQTTEDNIVLFPAWPREWHVDFKLHAAGNITVEGCYHGTTPQFQVSPLSIQQVSITLDRHQE